MCADTDRSAALLPLGCRFSRLAAELAQHIESLRNISSTDARAVSAAVFQQAVEACIVNMQNTIEGLCHNLQKQAAKRAATAGVLLSAVLFAGSIGGCTASL